MQGPAAHNADIARVFGEIADLLEIQQANPFRIRAYRNAARVVEGLQFDLAAGLGAGGELPKLPGIGADLDAKIREIAATGTCALFEKLKRQLPSGIADLLHVPGLGPKRVQRLYRDLDVQTLEQLYRAASIRGGWNCRSTRSSGSTPNSPASRCSKASRWIFSPTARSICPTACSPAWIWWWARCTAIFICRASARPSAS